MVNMSSKQINILKALVATGRSLTRQEMEPYAGRKGYSKALGAATREVTPDSLEALGYVRRFDAATPFRYEVTTAGMKALIGQARPNSPATPESAEPSPQPAPQLEQRNVPSPVQRSADATLRDIESKLKSLFPIDAAGRPFVCDGSPLDCQVAEVGINPGTPTPFWPYWNPTTGFDKAAWLQAYRNQHGRLKPTRDRIEVLCKALRPQRCIELNLYPTYSTSEANLAHADRDTALFDYLLDVVRPRVIVVHGDTAARHIGNLMGTQLIKDDFVSGNYRGHRMLAFQSKSHFRLVSRDYVRSVAQRVLERLTGDSGPSMGSSATPGQVR